MKRMKRFFLGVVAGVCGMGLVPLCADSALADKRVALVIGNAAYQNAAALPNPVNDATAIEKMFRDVGFDVVQSRFDLGVLELKRAIREFTLQARDADIAVVYYAGHGIEIGGINYLVPVDARLATDVAAEDEAVPLDRVIRAVEPAHRLRLVILDACRDNPFGSRMQHTVAMRAVSNGLARIEPTLSDTMIAYAAKAGSTVADGSGANSPFTAALLKHLPEPGVDVRIAFGRVRDDVWAQTAHRQEPFVYGSFGGAEVPLVPAAHPAEPAPAADGGAEARRAYELTANVGTRAAWEAFLKGFTTGLYADLARAQLARLAAAEKPAPAASALTDVAARERLATEAAPAQADDEPAARHKSARSIAAHRHQAAETRHHEFGSPRRHEAARWPRFQSWRSGPVFRGFAGPRC
jgi:uncharacterized caspase-like protein